MNNMSVKLWGVRGSLPSPITPNDLRERFEEILLEFERLCKQDSSLTAQRFLQALPPTWIGGYGGNTACGEIISGKSRLIIDAGSGLRKLSEHLMRTEPNLKEYHLYFTHFHWDHLIGLPFFVPMYIKGKTINIYAVHDDLEENIRALFRKPFFPVPFEVIAERVKFHRLEPRQPFHIGDLKATPYQLDHPDPCWGLRLEANGKSVAWAVDNECSRHTRDELGPDKALYQNADVMIFDAQYSFHEALEKINWGHSSGPIGIDLALREGIKRALFIHHDPAASDDMIRAAEEETQSYFEHIARARKKAGDPEPKLLWHFAREGETINL